MSHYFRQFYFGVKGYFQFTRQAYENKEKSWQPSSLDVDLSSRKYVVSGANSGLGKEAAMGFAKRGAEVHMLCRNEEKGNVAADEIKQATGNNNVHLHIVDVSRPQQVKNFASSFLQQHTSIHCLVNNAGVLKHPREETPDGLDVNFATSTLGTFVLTNSLLPALLKDGREHPDDPARVVVVSSGGMYTARLDVEDPECKHMQPYSGVSAYAQTKRQQVCLTEKWARDHTQDPVIFHSMHPGWAATPGVASSLPGFNERMQNSLRSAEQGADTIVWLGVSPEVLQHGKSGGGLFFLDREPVETHLPLSGTTETQEEVDALWDLCDKIVENCNN
eukprot:gb/GECH01007243.1/.p1 GENE.gb/GECH01007243.1/~~gb/GECH01007243.1/.p1  ORF type:complete len:333 (+),score=89.86 gb/GECH01007243.1/:1-999(+)